MKKPRVKLTAISSNEGYFLPQWIYHHFYFGFDAIELIINRNTDNTREILSKMQRYYPNLTFMEFDWLDSLQGPNGSVSLQAAAYMHTYYNTSADYDYVMYYDVDEFWYPLNGYDTVQQCIMNFAWPDGVAFEMYQCGGVPDYIIPFTSRSIFNTLHIYACKYLLKTQLKVDNLFAFGPKLHQDAIYLTGAGYFGFPKTDQSSHCVFSKNSKGVKYILLHDFCRSPLSFLAKFARASAMNPTKDFTEIRRKDRYYYFEGKLGAQSNPDLQPVEIENLLPDIYFQDFATMIDRLSLSPLINEALIYQYLYALEGLRRFKNEPESDFTINVRQYIPNVDTLAEKYLAVLSSMDSSYASIAFTDIDVKNFESNESSIVISSLLKAIHLYPFAVDEAKNPIYFKMLAEHLIKLGKFDRLRAFLEDDSFLTIQAFGKEWAYPLLAEGYEKSGNIEEALIYYNKMKYWHNINYVRKIIELS